MIRTMWAVAAIGILGLAGAANIAEAAVVDNSPLDSPPGVFFGTGNANSNFTVDNDGGIQIGLSAITRFLGPIVPTGNVYSAPLGDTTEPGKTGSAWGVDFSINTQPGGVGTLNISDITATLTFNDAVTHVTGSGNPLAIPDNAKFGTTAVQNSESGSFLAAVAGDASFSDLVNDTYTFTLDIFNANDALIASDTIVVQAGTGAPVPEPASLALLGTGILGMAIVRRRRKG
jgi:hypothetical protein